MGTPIPIMAGVRVDGSPDIRIDYPLNLVPVPPQEEAKADMYLRPAEGITRFGTAQGVDRAGIVWKDPATGISVHYRVSGSKLVSVSSAGVVVVIGDVGPVAATGPARMDFGFDRLAILSGGFLWYYTTGGGLIKQTDPNIPANLIDMVAIDGYYAVTDGINIAVSDLAAPSTFNPLKFGTTDRPDPVQCLLKVANELTVVSQNFIDVFKNVGGVGFPFARISSAVITRGAVGRQAACVFNDATAFVGTDRNEEPGVYAGRNAQAIKLSTVEIDNLLGGYSTADLATIEMERVFTRGGQFLFVHLPDRTIVYDAIMSAKLEQPVWHVRTSSLSGFGIYKARHFTRAADAWVVGDPQSSALGVLSKTDSQHYGLPTRWEFSTPLLRNGNTGAIIHTLQLLALTGIVTFGTNPTISTSYTEDGVTFSMDESIPSGIAGERAKMLLWIGQGSWQNFRIQRFRGDSGSRLTIMGLDAEISPLQFGAA